MNVNDQTCIEITMHTGNFWLRVGVWGRGFATLASGSLMQVLFLGPQIKDLWSGWLSMFSDCVRGLVVDLGRWSCGSHYVM